MYNLSVEQNLEKYAKDVGSIVPLSVRKYNYLLKKKKKNYLTESHYFNHYNIFFNQVVKVDRVNSDFRIIDETNSLTSNYHDRDILQSAIEKT